MKFILAILEMRDKVIAKKALAERRSQYEAAKSGKTAKSLQATRQITCLYGNKEKNGKESSSAGTPSVDKVFDVLSKVAPAVAAEAVARWLTEQDIEPPAALTVRARCHTPKTQRLTR